jgi:molybdopterin/thiamine biosynthesis adenylyltransferase
MIPTEIVVIGAGGNGSWLTFFLTQFVFYHEVLKGVPFVIADFDEFEDRNGDRQFFARPGNKAASLVGTFNGRFKGQLNLQAKAAMIVSKKDYGKHPHVLTWPVDYLIHEGAVVFLCVDAFYPRMVTSLYAQQLKNVCVINGGTGLSDWNVDVYLRRDGEDVTFPLEEIHPEVVELADQERETLFEVAEDEEQDEEETVEASCTARLETEEASQTFAANLSTATLMFQAFCALLEDRLTVNSIIGSLSAQQEGVWGPSQRIVL